MTRGLMVVALAGLGTAIAACSSGETGTVASPDTTLTTEGRASKDPMLNLSHITCNDDGTLDIHFVLLFWGNSTPPNLDTTVNGTSYTGIHEDKHSGNVWHYDLVIPFDSGFVDVSAANVGTTTLHNPDAYYSQADGTVYTCGGTPPPSCSVEPRYPSGTVICINPNDLGGNSPKNVCKYFLPTADGSYLVKGRDDGPFGSDSTGALSSAYVVIVKGGSGGGSQTVCPTGTSVYHIYTNVTANPPTTLTTGNGTNVSDVTYCGCPDAAQ